jgi:hypothetical protein
MRARRRFRFRMVEGVWFWAEYFRLRRVGNASGSENPGHGAGLGGLNRLKNVPPCPQVRPKSGLQKPAPKLTPFTGKSGNF